jgi:acyl carrier protein
MDTDKRILAFLRSELGKDARRVDAETPLLTGLVDSMQVMELASFLEEEFGIRLEFADMSEENFRNVQTLTDLVTRKLG